MKIGESNCSKKMEKTSTRKKYNLTKPRTETHPQNRVKSFSERKVQLFFSVRGQYAIEANKIIQELINQKKWHK